MAVNIAMVLSAEWASDPYFMEEVREGGNKDFLITYFGLDSDRKRRSAAGFAATYVCHPYSDRESKRVDRRTYVSSKRRSPKDGIS